MSSIEDRMLSMVKTLSRETVMEIVEVGSQYAFAKVKIIRPRDPAAHYSVHEGRAA
jgi:hypothetical protein